MLVYAWALEQENDSKRRFDQQDVMVPWNLQKTYVDEGGGKEASPCTVDEDRDSVVYQRYCHVYCEGELESLGKDTFICK
jgi:hypothetical protein